MDTVDKENNVLLKEILKELKNNNALTREIKKNTSAIHIMMYTIWVCVIALLFMV